MAELCTTQDLTTIAMEALKTHDIELLVLVNVSALNERAHDYFPAMRRLVGARQGDQNAPLIW